MHNDTYEFNSHVHEKYRQTTQWLHYLGTHNLAFVMGSAHVSLFLGHFCNWGSLHVIEGLTDVKHLHDASQPPSENTADDGFKHTC